MKKRIISYMRKVIWLILRILKFPKLKDKNYYNLDEIVKEYKSKRLDLVYNNLKIMGNIDLSIIIPVYNSESLIKKCLESLINQKTKYKYNIILINDGSTDNSLRILKEYEEKYNNITVLTQKNRGIAETRNVRNKAYFW